LGRAGIIAWGRALAQDPGKLNRLEVYREWRHRYTARRFAMWLFRP
jgi:hypothetical protein